MPRLNREQSRNLTRSRILSAARSEMAQHGFASVSIDQIADAAGFSRGAFYSNYRNKRDLLIALIAESHENEIQTWQDLIDQSTDLESAFPVLEKQFNDFAEHREWRMLSSEIELYAERDSKFGKVYREYDEKLFEKVKELAESLCVKAGLESEVDIEAFAYALRSLSAGLMRNTQSFGSRNIGDIIIFFLRSVLRLPFEKSDVKKPKEQRPGLQESVGPHSNVNLNNGEQ